MLKRLILSIFVIFIFANSQIEEYIYDIEIKGISIIAGNVGKCSLKIEKNKDNEYEMDIVTKTTRFAKILYPYVDEIKLKINHYFSLLSIEQNTSNRKQKLKIDVDKNNKTITKNGEILNFYADTLFSPYSLIYFLRKKELIINDKHNYKIFDGGKIKNILLEVSKIEKIKVPYGNFECVHIKPTIKNGTIKNNGIIELWYTNNKEKIPIKIKLETKIGTFIMKLKKIN